jgi:hypothetical protein
MANTYTLIESKTLGSDTASVSFTSIPQTYTDLQLLTSVRIDRAGISVNMGLRFNTNSSNYKNMMLYGSGANPAGSLYSTALDQFGYWYSPANSTTASTFSNQSVYIPNYTSSYNKSVSINSTSENNATDTNLVLFSGVWSDSAAITTITLSNYQGSNLRSGSTFYLYGIKNS